MNLDELNQPHFLLYAGLWKYYGKRRSDQHPADFDSKSTSPFDHVTHIWAMHFSLYFEYHQRWDRAKDIGYE